MIKYLPNELLAKIAPEKKIKKLITPSLTLKKAALSFVSDIDFIHKDTISDVALQVVKQYKARFEDNKDEGLSASDAKEDAINDGKLLVNRVENTIVSEVAGRIKDVYSGEYYTWLPSDAEVPDPLHQLNYGKKFKIGVGEMPGDRYGCRCGLNILVKETELEL